MDRKRKLDSTEVGVVEGIKSNCASIRSREIMCIILADDYIRLQENIEKGLIKDVNMLFTNETDKSLLMAACEAGSIECVKVLLVNNADVNYESKLSTVLTSACKSGNIDIVNLILSSDFKIELLYLTLYYHLFVPPSTIQLLTELVTLIISRLPDVNRWVHGDRLLLHQAAFGGHVDLVRMLLERGADPNIISMGGCDALYLASLHGRLDVIKLLLESDIPHKISIKSINNAFFECCLQGYIDAVRYLISKGAQVNAAEEDGDFAIDYAIRKNNLPLAKVLIEGGFDVNNTHLNYLEVPLLFLACRPHIIDMIQLLLDSGADPNVRYGGGSSVLLDLVTDTCAKRAGYVDMPLVITLLLTHGAHVNIAHERTGETALMIAAQAQHIDLVKLLLEYGADVTQVNRKGKSVLDMVGRTRSHAKVAELCQAYIDSNRVDSKAILK